MARDDGNGWVHCRCGQRHWGRHGAAGLLLLRPGAQPAHSEVLLQLRSHWTHHGGTWGIPGGAVDSHESPCDGALREAYEEADITADGVQVVACEVGTDHGDWSYVVVVGRADARVHPRAANDESVEVRWVDVDAVRDLDLHPGLAATWPRLRDLLDGMESLDDNRGRDDMGR